MDIVLSIIILYKNVNWAVRYNTRVLPILLILDHSTEINVNKLTLLRSIIARM